VGAIPHAGAFGGANSTQASNGGTRNSQGSMPLVAKPSFSRSRGTQNIPYAKYVKRRDEGRCYHCGNAFGPGHRCPKKAMRVLIMAEDEQIDDNREISRMEKESEHEEKREEAPDVKCQWMDLLVCLVGGLTKPQTMKLKGELQGARSVDLDRQWSKSQFCIQQIDTKIGTQARINQTLLCKIRGWE